jgi:peptide/nickel transport system permease protein
LPAPGRFGIYEVMPNKITGLVTIDSLLTGNINLFFDALKHMILPAFCLGYRATASIARMSRSSMLEVMSKDYIRTARSKGLAERVVILRHALKNAMIPTVTISGIMFGNLLSGSVLVETVFAWPGLGYYATKSLGWLDFQAIMGVTLILTLLYSFANLAVDIIYGFLDPKIKY